MRIGIDLGGTKIEGVVLDADGRELARERIATPQGDYQATVRAVAELALRLERQVGRPCSVGVGTPGSLSPFTGLIRNANSVVLNGKALDVDLSAALQRPVRLANDADCFALSETHDGAGAGAASVFGVILGTGVGGGVVVDGKLLSGPNGVSGEWGHNPLPWLDEDDWPLPPCWCGKRGCIETFLSGPGMSEDHLRRTGERLPAHDIVARAAAGNVAADATLSRYERRLARALAAVINLLDPAVIVLGGGMSKIERLYRRVPELWGEYVFSDRVVTALRPPRFGDASGVRGAAWLWPASD